MSVRGVLSISDSSVEAGRIVYGTMTLTNDGDEDVDISTMVPRCSAGAVDDVIIEPGTVKTISAGGSLKKTFRAALQASRQPSGNPVQVRIGCDVSLSDGSTVDPPECTVNVVPPGFFTTWSYGQTRYDVVQLTGSAAGVL